MRNLTIIVLGLAAAGPVVAECLDDADLGRGVAVTYDTGDVTTFRRVADGSVQVDERYANGDPALRLRAVHGIYFVEEVSLGPDGAPEPGTRLRVELPIPAADLPRPGPGVTWSGETLNVWEDGGERQETTSVSFAPGAPFLLGDCTYQTLEADLRYDWGAEGGVSLGYLYLTEIGVGLIVSRHMDDTKAARMTPVALDLASK